MTEQTLRMLFFILLAGSAVISGFAAALILFRIRPETLPRWESLPRNREAGGILGLAALLAFIPNVAPMFSVRDNLVLLIILAVILAGACYRYLDYLFARAFAGALILLAHFFLAESFSLNADGSAFFAVMCLALGTAGIFIAAKPYWMRDWIRKIALDPKIRYATAALPLLFILSALCFLPKISGVLK